MNRLSVSPTAAGEVSSEVAIVGNAGSAISIDKGGSAASMPRSTVKLRELGLIGIQGIL
ncbi:MAG: hypothetical protein U7126_16710 [Microcoleus sp.]